MKLEPHVTRYTEEEKKVIMARLQAERLKKESVKIVKESFSLELTCEERREILLKHKKCYRIEGWEFYKVLDMDQAYFIETRDLKMCSPRPQMFSLYYQTMGQMKRKPFLIKMGLTSDKLIVSEDPVRICYKTYRIEDEI